MILTNQQVHEALDYCVERVKEGRIWVCLRFEEYCDGEFLKGRDYLTFQDDFRQFSRQVQEFLGEEHQKLHKTPTSSEDIDVEVCLAGPNGYVRSVKETDAQELRLRMIEWLRTQYPLEKDNG